MRVPLLLSLAWFSSFLVGCISEPRTSLPTVTPTPPFALLLSRVPEARPWDGAFSSCARNLGWQVDILDLSYPLEGKPTGDVWLFWGTELPEPEAPTYRLDGWRALPVVHRDVEVSRLSLEGLRAVYRGEKRSWVDLGGRAMPLLPLLPPPGHPVYRALEALIAPFSWPGDLIWTATPEEVLTYAQEHPGALGWIPESWQPTLPSDLRVLPLALAAADLFGPWPLLAQASEAIPQEALAAYLGCVRSIATTSSFPQEASP